MQSNRRKEDEFNELDEDEMDSAPSHSSHSSENDFIKIKKDSLWKYSTFVLIAVIVIGGFLFFSGKLGGGGINTGNVVANPQPSIPGPSGEIKVSVDDDAVLGNKNAPVTIIEFSDYQCPFCGRHYQQTHPQIKKNYIDTGKVKLVFRDFPLSFHPMAQPAAEAAECVGENGDEAYYKMHDKIFENQDELSESNLKAWAKELGYNIDNCLDSGKYKSEVQKDLDDSQVAGGQGTPYFVIVGKDGKTIPLSGAQPFTAFDSALKSVGA